MSEHVSTEQLSASMASIDLKRTLSELKDFNGPCIKFNGVLDNVWYGSVLIVAKDAPRLVLIDTTEQVIEPFTVYKFKEHHFIRYSFNLPLNQPRAVSYRIDGYAQVCTFQLPQANAPLNVLWHSCNGFSHGVDQTKYPFDGLWQHVLHQHQQLPYHCQMGGGDQLYCDDVFDECKSLVKWLKIVSKTKREKHEWTPEMETETTEWFFRHYAKHFAQPGFQEAVAQIPYAFIADDHDFFDGYGSYPDRLQNCEVFQGIFNVAYRFYLLFQHHSREDLMRQEGYIGDRGHSCIRHLGNDEAVLLVDTRRERTKEQVVHPTSYRRIFDALERLPNIQHLFVLLPVPIVYPRLKKTEKALTFLSSAINNIGPVRAFTKQFQKNGIFTVMISKFGEPELLDDLCDHWTAHDHKPERKTLVESLQDYAEKSKTRISFVSGDVHCAGVGRFFSGENRETDPHDMTQIITSAIVNEPPPDAVINVLHLNEKTHHLNMRTKEEMFDTFTQDVNNKPLKNPKLMRRRNFARSQRQPDGSVLVELHVEMDNVKEVPKIYPVVVPALK